MIRKQLIAALGATIGLAGSVSATTVFSADFEGSVANTTNPAAPDDDGLGNGSETNANLGTSVGSWEAQTNGDELFGAVYSNAGGTNKALLYDTPLSGNSNALNALYSEVIDLTTHNVEVEFDVLASRQANGRRVEFSLGSGNNNAYSLVFQQQGTKSFGYNDGSVTLLGSANAGTGDALVNPADGGGNAPDDMIHVKFTLSGGATSAERTALLFVDWDGDGDFTTSTSDVTDINGAVVAVRNAAVDSSNRIRISGNQGTYGVWLDNFTVTTSEVPEPSSLALLSLGGLMMARRRK